ncbi:MAG TPA: GTP 3',8-cyclase MoaA [Acidimicrobiales bacterium]|nr:GTP 3',8-cyclase MoaA [Acidimicrobiales bacterium]
MAVLDPPLGPSGPLLDTFGRTARDLRISITDRCNFRCTYCMPEEGMEFVPREELLSFEEIARLARLFVEDLGIESIRLTGGEPTVRRDLHRLVSMLADLRTPAGDPVEVSLTTNGSTLARQARLLREAGLTRVNVSLDSLRADRFAAITRRDALGDVLAGIDAAVAAGLHPVKVNAVVVRGQNDDEIVDFARFGRDKGVQIRFIEYMPLDASGTWSMEQVVSADEIVRAIAGAFPLEQVRHGSEPASRWRYLDGAGEIGVIPSVTRPFCGDCDRVRLTAEGKFLTCLFAIEDLDLRHPLRSGASDADLGRLVKEAVHGKWAGHRIGKVDFVRPRRSMSQIGG